ncbi:MAG: transporter [Azospirillaceae bacterium]|nr:transporter [Azospirillaceae bacterium]
MNPRKTCAFALAASALVLLSSGSAWAGAWPTTAGTVDTITSISDMTSSSPAAGQVIQGSNSFEKFEVSPLISYGLTDSTTVQVQPRWQQLTARDVNGNTTRTSGFSDLEVAGRFRLWSDDQTGSVFSVQPLVSLPTGYDPDRQPALGSGHPDYEMRALYGTNLNILGLPAFFDGELAYRARTGPPADEAKLDLTLGVRPDDKWMLLAQSFTTLTVGNAGQGYQPYKISKLEFSVVRSLTDHISLQFGYEFSPYYENLGSENTWLGGVWVSF